MKCLPRSAWLATPRSMCVSVIWQACHFPSIYMIKQEQEVEEEAEEELNIPQTVEHIESRIK